MTDEQLARRRGRIVGIILMAIGGLIFTLCGLCSVFGFWMITELSKSQGGADPFGALVVVLIVGGIPLAIGGGLFAWGLALWRRSRKPLAEAF